MTQVSTSTPEDRLYRIAEEGLCIGCGMCQSAVPGNRIVMCRTPEDELRPIAKAGLTHKDVDLVYEICPSLVVRGMEAERIAPDTKLDDVWGPWRRAVRMHAKAPEIRHEGSTGGVLTALGLYLLHSKRVQFLFHVKASAENPTFGEAHISRTPEDVIAAAGSRYGPTAMLASFDAVLAEGAPFAFIGKPCDIAAAKNFGRRDARVGERVKYWLTPVCGAFMPSHGTRDFLAERGHRFEDVKRMRYRGRGCPGPTTVETAEGVFDYGYLDLWGDGKNGWTMPWRCKICPDGIGEAADIAASDTWPGGTPTPEMAATDPGTNAVIARTKAGQELLEAAVEAGYLTEQWDVTPDEMSHYQMHQMQKKFYVWPRLQALADEGYLVPQTEGLRIAELAAQLPEATNDAQRQGTRKRLRAGRSREPRPRCA
jgi:coenzyme F420 hydrogenase subunit beta